MYAKIENGAITQYPYTLNEFRAANPSISFPAAIPADVLAEYGVAVVVATQPPDAAMNETVTEVTPTFDSNKERWVQSWQKRPATLEEVEARQKTLYDAIVVATQERLDTHAQAHGYDGILSACTYATSAVPRFKAEAQYCVNLRDATWATLFTIMQAVQAGSRPIPTSYSELESELPALNWPAV